VKPEIPEFELPAHEISDWAYGRTPRTAILVPSAEWVQSVYTCEFDLDGWRFLVPNRDFPYEGLLVHCRGENWKFIDAVAISLQVNHAPLRLRHDDPATCVRVTPFRAVYCYAFEEVTARGAVVAPRLHVTYSLDSPTDPATVTGRIEIDIANPWPGITDDVELMIQPFLDIRHMFGAAEFDKYSVETSNDAQPAVRVRVYNRALTFHFPEGELTRFWGPERLSWWYKLGTGQRAEIPNDSTGRSATQFLGERKEVVGLFRFRPTLAKESTSVTVRFICQFEEERHHSFPAPDYAAIEAATKSHQESLWRQAWEMTQWNGGPEERLAIAGRIAGMVNMRIFAKACGSSGFQRLPPAGAWWFRTPWFRDAFEGLLSNFRTLSKLRDEEVAVAAAVDLALGFQDPVSGLVPNRVPEFSSSMPAYDGSDATLLCLIAGLRHGLESGDSRFARRILYSCVRTINRFRRAFASGEPNPGRGPRLTPERGLLLTCPRHSWIDTSNQEVYYAGQHMKGLPNRASPALVEDMYDAIGDPRQVERLLSSPRFFMPELNAQWLTVLDLMSRLVPMVRRSAATFTDRAFGALLDLKDRARRNYLEMFWNDETGFLYNLVFEDGGVRDSVDCECAVVAAGMLGSSLFSQAQLEAIWKRVQAKLLVSRRLTRLGDGWLPFGVLAMSLDKRIFYGDPEYHADTVWLRSTPYLILLLRSIGKSDEAKAVALNALDHQMSEGAIFYNNELLALPFGNNDSPDERTRGNPVPVKNPLQFWSQWCDELF